MSASLVGSEMCIRDSPAAPAGRRLLEPAAAWQPAGCRGCAGHAAVPMACLLYTSDAADDM
eukprot:7336531-Alexandrium_andersonii.AAC.1